MGRWGRGLFRLEKVSLCGVRHVVIAVDHYPRLYACEEKKAANEVESKFPCPHRLFFENVLQMLIGDLHSSPPCTHQHSVNSISSSFRNHLQAHNLQFR